MMKLLVIGSRRIKDIDISPYIPKGVEIIISGAAKGVDSLAEQYADKMRISKYIIRPDYAKYRRGAPLKRNCEMVNLCDEVLAFWDGLSKGTKQTIDYAKKIGKPVNVIIVQKM